MRVDPVYLITDQSQRLIDPCVAGLRQSGFEVRLCQSVAVLCDAYDPDCPTCILILMWSHEFFGIEIYHTLQKQSIHAPAIILLQHADIPIAVSAIKQGVFDVLSWPNNVSDLKNAVIEAGKSDVKRLEIKKARHHLQVKLGSLTPREIEILQHVVNGLSSSQIAYKLTRSEKTIKLHRAHIMKKLAFDSAHELVQQMIKLHFDLDHIAQSCLTE